MLLHAALLESTRNIAHRIIPAAKHGPPVLRGDQPWEQGMAILFGSVLFDQADQCFKAWYHIAGGHTAYAVSRDGIQWDKPELDVTVLDGRRTNIVIERGRMGHFYEICGVLVDPRDPDPQRRYKAGFVSIQRDYTGPHADPFHPGSRRGFGTAVSADGIHWRLEQDFATDAVCDISRCCHDPRTGRFLLYGRTKLSATPGSAPWRYWGWGRAVVRLESADFRTWSTPELVLAADAADPEGTEIYSLTVAPWGTQYLGFAQMFHGKVDQGLLDIQLAVSEDGRAFDRLPPRQPLIAEGDVGTWDRFNIALGSGPPLPVGGDLWVYYSGRTYRHSPYRGPDSQPGHGSIGLAVVQRGRYCALEASFDGGTLVTAPLQLPRNRLWLDANAAYGQIDVALLATDGTPVPGSQRHVTGVDHTALELAFESIGGRPVQVQLELRNAQVFGIGT